MRKMIEVKAGENIKLNSYGFSCVPKINTLWTIYNEDGNAWWYCDIRSYRFSSTRGS